MTPDRTAQPALVAVAHGSSDPRAAAAVATLLGAVRALSPGLDVRPAFLGRPRPGLGEALWQAHGDGHREVVVLPLLLGAAFHARTDLPAAVDDAVARLPGPLRVLVADVLGPDPRLPAVALRRLSTAGVALGDPALGVVLAAAGSSHPPANAAVRAVARAWALAMPWHGVLAAFATTATPSVSGAIAALRASGARRVAVASWFLAPGVLPARVAAEATAADPRAVVAAPLVTVAAGADPGLAQLVLQRYRAAIVPAHYYDRLAFLQKTGAIPAAVDAPVTSGR